MKKEGGTSMKPPSKNPVSNLLGKIYTERKVKFTSRTLLLVRNK